MLQVKHLSSTLEALRKSYSELETKAEGYLATMRQEKEEHSHMEELLRVEMAQHVSQLLSFLFGSCEGQHRPHFKTMQHEMPGYEGTVLLARHMVVHYNTTDNLC